MKRPNTYVILIFGPTVNIRLLKKMGDFGGISNLEELIGDALITPTDFKEQLKNCVGILDTMDNSLD